MATYQANRIHKHTFHGKTLERGDDEPYIIGFDSEADTTSDGRPMLFQYSLPGTTEQATITQEVPPTKHAGLGCFLDFVDTTCTVEGVEYLIYVWNLSYEFTQLFHDLPHEVVNESEWTIRNVKKRDRQDCYDWELRVSNDKRQLLTLTNTDTAATVRVLDGTAFYKVSLDSAAKMLGVGEKYSLESLSRSLFSRRDLLNAEFIAYAKRDAYITRLIGEYIQQQHRDQGIATCISAPHFAATVYRTNFLHGELPPLDIAIEQAGLYSYHGGKNGFYLDGPADIPQIYNYDITSAYPEAMRQLPDAENSSWKEVNAYEVGAHAIYHVDLDYTACKYKGLQTHEGAWADSGHFQLWTTSYELDEILSAGEATLTDCHGYQLLGPSGGSLARYVDKYFALKSTATGPVRQTAKLLLVSLYGKFFQKQPIGRVGNYDLDAEAWVQYDSNNDSFDYEAGGLYNPPVASLITGYVRAKIHRLEHKYESVMTSTDGFFGIDPPSAGDIGRTLGQLTVQRGRLRIWRERLYIFDPIDGDAKVALHGFHAGRAALEDIPLRRGEYKYFGRQMITLKMSTRDQRAESHSPGEFVNMMFTLRI